MRGHVAGTSCSDQVPSTSEMKAIVRWTNFAAEIQFISQEFHSFFYFRGVTASYCVAPIGHRKFDNNNYLNQRKIAFPGCLWYVWFVYCVIFLLLSVIFFICIYKFERKLWHNAYIRFIYFFKLQFFLRGRSRFCVSNQ